MGALQEVRGPQEATETLAAEDMVARGADPLPLSPQPQLPRPRGSIQTSAESRSQGGLPQEGAQQPRCGYWNRSPTPLLRMHHWPPEPSSPGLLPHLAFCCGPASSSMLQLHNPGMGTLAQSLTPDPSSQPLLKLVLRDHQRTFKGSEKRGSRAGQLECRGVRLGQHFRPQTACTQRPSMVPGGGRLVSSASQAAGGPLGPLGDQPLP